MLHGKIDLIVLAASLVLLGIHTGADAYLGDVAEYFNLWHVVLAWADVFNVGDVENPRFLYGQDDLGRAALPLATLLIIAEAVIVYHVIDYARCRSRLNV